ncbi:MAG: adenylate/guanylate cyclase domain-containing protein [Cyanobacteria bacterium P01_F01_bin.86]
MKPRFSLSIGTKIFGIATSMLTLLLGVTYLSYIRIRQVSGELTDIAVYLAPLTENLAEINVHALEQEIHFERMLRYYEIEPMDEDRVKAEAVAFETRGQQVDEEIAAAIELADAAAHNTYKLEDALEVARIRPLLTVLEEDHQKLHELSLQIIELLEADNKEDAEFLTRQLADFEDDFDARLQGILFELTEFIEGSAAQAQAHEQNTLRVSWWFAGIATGVGVVFASLVTAGLVRPVRRLVAKTQVVEQGNLEVELPVYSTDEVGKLTDSFNTLVQELREKERLKTTFGQYVDPRIVETLLAQQSQSDSGQRQMMTLFFSDIAGFSRISEVLTPAGLVTLINEYLTLASVPIKEHRGVINQFIGDAVSAFWGVPFVGQAEHAKLACYAALEQFDQLAKLRRALPDLLGIRKGIPEINVRVGLASGEVVTGNIGSENSKSYTVMGAAVQMAEKLEEANKIYGTRILITAKTRELAGEVIETREIDAIALSDSSDPEPIYELLGITGSTDERLLQLNDYFQAARSAYQEQRWSEAEAKFQKCLEFVPEDGPSRYYMAKIESQLMAMGHRPIAPLEAGN